MESLTNVGNFLPEFLIEIIAAILCGGLIGLNRSLHHKAAGIRDNILICLGAVLYMNISKIVAIGEPGGNSGDPARIAAQVVTGIGFIGAGVIIQGSDRVAGLTTAATIWVVGAVGLIIGANQVLIGMIATGFILLILVSLHKIEDHLFLKYDDQKKKESEH
ncbi:MgtC/SapB family protein [bacterium]|nr:MgtC/SapB family protein [bacterium]